MDYTTFAQLWREAQEYTDFTLYVAERGWQSCWMDVYAEHGDNAVLEVLTRIWYMAHGGTKAMRSMLGHSQAAFANYFGLPRRTVENWESGANVPSSYVVSLLAFAVLSILESR